MASMQMSAPTWPSLYRVSMKRFFLPVPSSNVIKVRMDVSSERLGKKNNEILLRRRHLQYVFIFQSYDEMSHLFDSPLLYFDVGRPIKAKRLNASLLSRQRLSNGSYPLENVVHYDDKRGTPNARRLNQLQPRERREGKFSTQQSSAGALKMIYTQPRKWQRDNFLSTGHGLVFSLMLPLSFFYFLGLLCVSMAK